MTAGVTGLRIDVVQVGHTVPRLVIRCRLRIRYFVHRFVFLYCRPLFKQKAIILKVL